MEKPQNASLFPYLFPISFLHFFFFNVSKVSFLSQILQQSQFPPTAARLAVHKGGGTEQTEQKAHLGLCLKLDVSLATWRTWYISWRAVCTDFLTVASAQGAAGNWLETVTPPAAASIQAPPAQHGSRLTAMHRTAFGGNTDPCNGLCPTEGQCKSHSTCNVLCPSTQQCHKVKKT